MNGHEYTPTQVIYLVHQRRRNGIMNSDATVRGYLNLDITFCYNQTDIKIISKDSSLKSLLKTVRL